MGTNIDRIHDLLPTFMIVTRKFYDLWHKGLIGRTAKHPLGIGIIHHNVPSEIHCILSTLDGVDYALRSGRRSKSSECHFNLMCQLNNTEDGGSRPLVAARATELNILVNWLRFLIICRIKIKIKRTNIN